MAQVDYYLKIDGIKGESTDDGHKEEIDLESWSWGQSNSGASSTGGGGGAGRVSMSDFSFTMRINKASPELFLACATGKHIKEALLTCRKAGGKKPVEYLKIKFADLLISSFQTGGSAGEVVPIESIAFNFSKIEYTYTPQKPDGSGDSPVTHNYDLKLNKGA